MQIALHSSFGASFRCRYALLVIKDLLGNNVAGLVRQLLLPKPTRHTAIQHPTRVVDSWTSVQ
jgi:hypothetical protein